MTTIFQARWWIASRVQALNVLALIVSVAGQFVPMIEAYWPSPQIALSVLAAGNILVAVLTQAKANARE